MLAFLLSTEFLFQPFVWRNYPPEEIASAWLEILRDRIVTALMLAGALSLAAASPLAKTRARVALQIAAVFAGAVAGELLLIWVDPGRQDRDSLVGRVLRWSLAGGAVAAIVALWRSAAAIAAESNDARLQEVQARRLAASSQLEALRRQIEPHFLFNTLATVRSLQRTDPEQGRHVLSRLLHYMSSALSQETPRTSLGDEIALVQAYLEVCASRISGGLTIGMRVDETLLDMEFPSLVLATLAENAIKHGVFPNNRGAVVISAERHRDRVEVAIADDGVGLSGVDAQGGGGLGLANTVERLRLFYGPGARLQLEPNTPRGVRACVSVPAAAG